MQPKAPIPVQKFYTDQELLHLLKAGDRQAFGQLYHRYKAKVYGISLKLIKSEVLAEELLQDVFVKIWMNRERIDPGKSFSSYLYRITENLVLDIYRRAARDRKLQERLVEAVSDRYSLEEVIYRKESMAILNKAIRQLPPQRRRVFTLCKLEGKSYEEAGRELGVTVSTVNDHIVKATRVIKNCLFRNQDVTWLLLIAAGLRS